MSVSKRFIDNFNYVSELKESSGVVSNKYKNVIEDVFYLGKLAIDKGVISISEFEDMINMIPENMEAFTKEHVERLDSVVVELKEILNNAKVEYMANRSDEKRNIKAAA